MRARNIKPGFFKNEDLSDCSIAARLLFPGLWMLADRKGRLEYRPKRWKGEIFPYDDFDTTALFAELEARSLVLKYEDDGKQYVWIPHFLDHQKPHQNESASTIPPHPCDHGDKSLLPKRGVLPAKDTSTRAESLFSESLLLNPESESSRSLHAGAHTRENSEFQISDQPSGQDSPAPQFCAEATTHPSAGGQDCSPGRPPIPPGQATPEYSFEFEELWDQYPRKEGKGAAWQAFKNAKAAHQYPGNPIVLPMVVAWRASPAWQEEGGRFVPMLSKWLRERRWDDGPPEDEAAKLAKQLADLQALEDEKQAARGPKQ